MTAHGGTCRFDLTDDPDISSSCGRRLSRWNEDGMCSAHRPYSRGRRCGQCDVLIPNTWTCGLCLTHNVCMYVYGSSRRSTTLDDRLRRGERCGKGLRIDNETGYCKTHIPVYHAEQHPYRAPRTEIVDAVRYQRD